jgi:hypothetical protein
MPNVGPTFFSSPVGDHPEGDGLTLFQTTFAGSSTADVSSFASGSAVITGGQYQTLSDGNLRISHYLGFPNISKAVWSSPNFNITSGNDWTLEIMLSVSGIPARPPKGCRMGGLSFGYYTPTLGISVTTSTFYTQQGGEYRSGTDILAPPTIQHLAFIARSPPGHAVDVYQNGVRIAQDQYWIATGTNGTIQLGEYANENQTWNLDFKGVRVRRAQMYPDVASFTPPASPAAWGPP